MTSLDALLPHPRLQEIDSVDLALPVASAWAVVRHGDLARTRSIKLLFALRALPARWKGKPRPASSIRLDEMISTPEAPGFQILVDAPMKEVAVGAIGKVWQPEIPFVHVENAQAFREFSKQGFVKVAWAIRLTPLGTRGTRVSVEVRVGATDPESWMKFRSYFALVGPASRFIRKSLLATLVRRYGTPEKRESRRHLPGDELLGNDVQEVTQGITIDAEPELIWPWLAQMGRGKAGFYSWDVLDNGGRRSFREVHASLQRLRPGEVIPAKPGSAEGFEVLRVDAPRCLILGGLYDLERKQQLPFVTRRPARFWHVTWAFVLEPIGPHQTRLVVRARVSAPLRERGRVEWLRFVHHLMEAKQLRSLKARAERTLPRDDARDVIEGLSGGAVMLLAALTPFGRSMREHWGLRRSDTLRYHPGDMLVPVPRWSWTHALEVDRPASEVWPWVSQIGASKAGFYSYQWLENLVGCDIRNSEVVHPEWGAALGDELRLHPRMPAPKIVEVEEGCYFVAHAAVDGAARARKKAWTTMSWLFLVEPLGETRCRVISRYRAACSDDLTTRLAFGPALLEPIGFAMDRKALLGIKSRAEGEARASH